MQRSLAPDTSMVLPPEKQTKTTTSCRSPSTSVIHLGTCPRNGNCPSGLPSNQSLGLPSKPIPTFRWALIAACFAASRLGTDSGAEQLQDGSVVSVRKTTLPQTIVEPQRGPRKIVQTRVSLAGFPGSFWGECLSIGDLFFSPKFLILEQRGLLAFFSAFALFGMGNAYWENEKHLRLTILRLVLHFL